MRIFDFIEGATPLLVSMPHDGTAIPDDVAAGMSEHALTMPDTDWHVSRLYDFAGELGAGILRPFHSRFVIDLNRPPDGVPLYPGASNTELCPTSCFDDTPIYREGATPDSAEIERRRTVFWQPYHDKLRVILDNLLARHGVALLFDAHSIRSEVPRFFQGRLPDLNLGTAGGTSCAPGLQSVLTNVLESTGGYTHVVNGRFTGGYITRTYGEPARNIHAVQLEQSQRTYMNETPPYDYRDDLAGNVRPALRALLQAMLDWAS